jgi:hypothetical protein
MVHDRPAQPPGLCDLHVHFSGAIRPRDYLRFLSTRTPWLETYERAMEAAYGFRPPLRHLLPRCLAGDEGAVAEFIKLFTFDDADSGSFSRFRAKLSIFSCTAALFWERTAQPDVCDALRAEARFFARSVRAGRQREGVGYAETRVVLGADMTPDMMAAVLGEILTWYAVPARQITEYLVPALPRNDPFPSWEVVREWALRPPGKLIAGIDFCGREAGHPPARQAALFAAVRQFNEARPDRALAILYHVGEVFEDKSLESAVRWVQEAAELGAHRLGHALAVLVEPQALGPHERTEPASERRDQIRYDLTHADALRAAGVGVDSAALQAEQRALDLVPADQPIRLRYDTQRLAEVRLRQDFAMRKLRHLGTVVEICPTSNRRMLGVPGVAASAVRRLSGHRVPFVVATDNPGLLGTTLRRETDEVAGLAAGCSAGSLRETAWATRSEVLSGRAASGRSGHHGRDDAMPGIAS